MAEIRSRPLAKWRKWLLVVMMQKSDAKMVRTPTLQEQAVLDAHNEGLVASDIARRLDISHQRVHQFYKRLGVSPNSYAEFKKKSLVSIEKLWMQGLTAQEIATHIGLSLQRVEGWVSEARLVSKFRAKSIEARRNKIMKLWHPDMSAGQLAQRLGVSSFTVLGDLTALGLRQNKQAAVEVVE